MTCAPEVSTLTLTVQRAADLAADGGAAEQQQYCHDLVDVRSPCSRCCCCLIRTLLFNTLFFEQACKELANSLARGQPGAEDKQQLQVRPPSS